MAEQTNEQITTRGAKVIGSGDELQASRATLAPLASTHALFNDLVTATAQEILAHLNLTGRDALSPDENQLVASYLRIVFKTGAAEGNHLLTRLVQAHGADGSDRNQIMGGTSARSGERMLGVIDRARTELAELPSTYRADLINALQKQFTKEQRATVKSALDALKESPSIDNIKRALRALAANKLLTSERHTQFKAVVRTFATDLRSAQAKTRSVIDDCKRAGALLDRRKSDKFAPWKDLGCLAHTPDGVSIFVRINDLGESWQRQIFQAAIEVLKSNINLEDYVVKEARQWNAALSKLDSIPDITHYRKVAALLEEILGKTTALNRFTPLQLVNIVERLGGEGQNWRGQGPIVSDSFKLDPYFKGQALAWNKIEDEGQKKQGAALFRRDLAALYPEVWELLSMHQSYKRLTGRRLGKPTLTLPNKYENPKHVMWAAAQYRKIDLQGEGPLKRGIRVQLPTLSVTALGLKETMQWFTATGDPRLTSLRRAWGAKAGSLQGIEEHNCVTGLWQPVNLGAIRLVPTKVGKLKLEKGDLEATDFKLKVTIKRDTPAAPKWIGEYLKGKTVDSLTNEPRLPAKLIVCSFVPDLMGAATFRSALVEQPSHGGRKIKWLKDEPFVVRSERAAQDAGIKTVATPADVVTARKGVQRLTENRLRLATLLMSLPAKQCSVKLSILQLRKDLPRVIGLKIKRGLVGAKAPRDTLVDVSYREIIKEIKSLRRRERGAWDHVTALGEARANGFAGEVARRIERLRTQCPGYEIAFVLEHRQERSASKAVWSTAFNKLVMSAAGAQLHNRVKETAQRLSPPIAVIERATHGLAATDLTGNETVVNAVPVELKDGQLILAGAAQHSLVIARDAFGRVRVRLVNTQDLVAHGLIRGLVTPSRINKFPDKAATLAAQQELFKSLDPKSIMRLLR